LQVSIAVFSGTVRSDPTMFR